MSVLIKGMEMPSCCMFCTISNSSGCGMMNPPVLMTTKEMLADRPDWCPLVPIPPHGRLIDADEFDERIRQAGGMCEEELTEDFKDGVQTVLAMLKTQTTIIPAEEGE